MSEALRESVPECFRGPVARTLLGAGRQRHLPAFSVLCEEGKVTHSLFLVTAGKFEVTKRIAGRRRTLSTFGPGSVLALMPALDGAPCAVSIRAREDASVVEIKRDNLLSLLAAGRNSNLEVADRLSLLAIRRLRGATRELSQALYCALTSPDQKGRIDTLSLARIQAGSYAWLGE